VNRLKSVALAGAGLALLSGLSACATASNPSDLVAVHYKGGAMSAKEYQDCLQPSERSGFDPGDMYAAYPARQISFDATGGAGAEAEPPKVVSKDKGEVSVPYTVTLFLKTDCDTLRKFHETIGTRFGAFLNVADASGDVTSKDMPDGWVESLNFVIGKPFDAALDRAAQSFTWNELWVDPVAKQALDDAITENAQKLISEQAGGEFFTDVQVLVQKPDPDPDLKAAVLDTQQRLETIRADKAAALADAGKQRAQANADAKTATAAIKKARAEAISRRLEVKGYGGIDGFLKAQCIEKNPDCNPWQPTFIYGGTPPQAR
jgi:hypothetical protein